MKVLLVDDYRTTTDLLADVACSMGHAVTRAYSGAEALAAAGGEGAFEFILLDIGLPDINGHELCMRLRASEKYASRRIFSITAETSSLAPFILSNTPCRSSAGTFGLRLLVQ